MQMCKQHTHAHLFQDVTQHLIQGPANSLFAASDPPPLPAIDEFQFRSSLRKGNQSTQPAQRFARPRPPSFPIASRTLCWKQKRGFAPLLVSLSRLIHAYPIP
eukprot:EG_transcript_29272